MQQRIHEWQPHLLCSVACVSGEAGRYDNQGAFLHPIAVVAKREPSGYDTSMLIRFDSKAGRLTMFGDVAVHLLKMMGHSGTVPSAILAADIPAAVQRLEKALENPPPLPAKPKQAEGEKGDGDEDREPRVSLPQRAYPLLQLLRNAAAQKVDVMWEQEGPAPMRF